MIDHVGLRVKDLGSSVRLYRAMLASAGDPPALPGRPPEFDIYGSRPVNSTP